jgi:hypothetical protein
MCTGEFWSILRDPSVSVRHATCLPLVRTLVLSLLFIVLLIFVSVFGLYWLCCPSPSPGKGIYFIYYRIILKKYINLKKKNTKKKQKKRKRTHIKKGVGVK